VKRRTEECRKYDQSDEYGHDNRIDETIRDNHGATLLPLPDRVQRSADLLGGTQPEEHGSMQSINVRNQHDRGHDKQQEVSKQEVSTPHGQLDNLDNEFTHRLRPSARAQVPAVPLASPPCSVSFIVFEFSRQSNSDEEL